MAFTAVVPSKVQKERIEICEACKWFKESTKSCGTLIAAAVQSKVGDVDMVEIKENKVRHYRKPIKLCGCRMPAKTMLTWAQCPADKWGRYGINTEELKDLRRIALELRKTGKLELMSDKHIKFQIYLRKLTGQNVEIKGCSSCINELLELSLSATQEIEID
jgi:hypothetical protein